MLCYIDFQENIQVIKIPRDFQALQSFPAAM